MLQKTLFANNFLLKRATKKITRLHKYGNFNKAMQEYERVKASGQTPDVILLSSVMHGYFSKQKHDEGFAIIQDFKTHNLKPSIITLNSILQSLLRRCNNADETIALFEQILSKFHIEPTTATNNIIIQHYAASGEPQKALARFYNMKPKPNERTFTNLLHGLFENKMLDEAVALFQEMLPKYHVQPDAIIYNTVIAGHLQHSRYASAMDYFAKMQENKIEPTEATFVTLINGLLQEGQTVLAQQVGNELSEKLDKYLTTRILNTMIHLMVKTLNLQAGEELFARMTMDKVMFVVYWLISFVQIKPDEATFGILIHACAESNDMLKAEEYMAKLKQHKDLSATRYIYGSLCYGYVKCGNLIKAESIFGIMAEDGIRPDTVMYNTLLQAYKERNMTDKSNEWKHKMKSMLNSPVATHKKVQRPLKL